MIEILLGLVIGIAGTEAYNNMPGVIREGDIVRELGHDYTERVVTITPSGKLETFRVTSDGTIKYYTYDNANNLILISK